MSSGQSESPRLSRRVISLQPSTLRQLHSIHSPLPRDVTQDVAFLPIVKGGEYVKQLWRSWSLQPGDHAALLSLDRHLQGFVAACQLVRTSAIKSCEQLFPAADMTWLPLAASPLNHTFWTCSPHSSAFAAFSPEGPRSSGKIEILEDGAVKCVADHSLSVFSCPERLVLPYDRPINTYFEISILSLTEPAASLSVGFSQLRRPSSDVLSVGQPRSGCAMLLTSASITCNGSTVSNVEEEFVAFIKSHGRQNGTVLGIHLDSRAGSVTFSIATRNKPAPPGSDSADAAASAPVNAMKSVFSNPLFLTIPWSPTDAFQPVIEVQHGSILLNAGELPFLLEAPSGAATLLEDVYKHAQLSRRMATLIASYQHEKCSSQKCDETITSALVSAVQHVLADPPLQLDSTSAPSSSNCTSFLQSVSEYEHELSILTNVLQDQEVFTTFFRASEEENLKLLISSVLASFSRGDIDAAVSKTNTPSDHSLSTSDDTSSLEPTGASHLPASGEWVDVSSALCNLPQLEIPTVTQICLPATPGTDDFAQRAAASLFDSSPPPSPRSISPILSDPRIASKPDVDMSVEAFHARWFACRTKFSAWLLDHTFVQAASTLLGISDAQTASESSCDSSVSAASIWQNVFSNFVQTMSFISPMLLSKQVPDCLLCSFCVAMHCAGAVVGVKNASVSFLDCILKFLEKVFEDIRSDRPVVFKSRLITCHIPSYVLACAAKHCIDMNSNKQLDPSILQYLHSPMFDGGFLESFSKWKFLDDFGSRQSGVSGTQKSHIVMSSFFDEIISDTKSGSTWLSIFSLAVSEIEIDSVIAAAFKSEVFKTVLSTFLHITGFVEFCSTVPDTPECIKRPIDKDTLRQLSPYICKLWESFFKDIVDQLKTGDHVLLLSHCRLCLSLAPPYADPDRGSHLHTSEEQAPAETLLERRISGPSSQGIETYVTELTKYLRSSVDDQVLKSIAAERDLIIQSRSFGFQILRKLLELVDVVEEECTLEFCRSMLCSVEMCFAPIVANERGSAHVVVGLSGTNRKSQQRMQSEWTQVMRCVIDTTHKILSCRFIGLSVKIIPLSFFLLNLFQQDSQWLKYGCDTINDILTLASGLDAEDKNSIELDSHPTHHTSKDFPSEGFAACAVSDGEWLCHGGIVVNNGVRSIFDGFWFVQDNRCFSVSSNFSLHRAWHTLTMLQPNEFVIIGGASMMNGSGLLCKAKVAIVKVSFDRMSMSVKLAAIPFSGFRSPIMHSALTLSNSQLSPVILIIGGLGKSKSCAQLICFNSPDISSSGTSAQRKRSSGQLAGRRRLSPPPPHASLPKSSTKVTATATVYSNKIFDVSPHLSSNRFPICFGSRPAMYRIPSSSQVIVSSVTFEESSSSIVCFNFSNTYSWSIIPLEGWPVERHHFTGRSFFPLSDGILLLAGGEDNISGDIATPLVVSLLDFSCQVLEPIPKVLRFGQHHCFPHAGSSKVSILGNWRSLPEPSSFFESWSFDVCSLQGSLIVRGLRSVLSGLCAQAALIPDKGFKIPILSPLLWSLQSRRLLLAHQELRLLRESNMKISPSIDVLHENDFHVYDSVIHFLDQGPQLIGFWVSIDSLSLFSGIIFSIGANELSLCSIEIDSCRYLVMKAISGVSSSPSPLPTNCWVHVAVSFLPAAIPQFCLYLNGFRIMRKDSWVSPILGNLRSKDLGVAFGNKQLVLCIGHRQGTDDTVSFYHACVQRNFEFTSQSCFDICSIPPPSVLRLRFLHCDIGSVLQSLRSVSAFTVSHIVQGDIQLMVAILDILFNGSASLAGPCALILVALIKEFPSLYNQDFFQKLLSDTLVFKLCDKIRKLSLKPGSFANRHHKNIFVFMLRELMLTSSFQPLTLSLLFDQLMSINFDEKPDVVMNFCKQAISLMDVFTNRLCLFPGLVVLASSSPSSPSTRCVVMRISADHAAVHIKSPSAMSYSCENYPISYLQPEKSDKSPSSLPNLPSNFFSNFWNLVSRIFEARLRFQDSIPLSAYSTILLENVLQALSSAIAYENSIDLSSFSQSLISQLLDLSFESTAASYVADGVTSSIVDTCLCLGWTVSKSLTTMSLNHSSDMKVNGAKQRCTSVWMQIGSRPVVKTRHATDARFHAGVDLLSGMSFKVGVVSSAGVRAICNSLKGKSMPQALISAPHPYRRAIFQVNGDFFQPHPPAAVPVEDCLSFKLHTDGPRSILSQNHCNESEGLYCSFTISAKEYSIIGLVSSAQLHLCNQQLEVAPVFFSPKVGQAGTEQFRAVTTVGQELTGWKEGQMITIVADPFARVVSAFVEDTLVGAFRCDCRGMRICISSFRESVFKFQLAISDHKKFLTHEMGLIPTDPVSHIKSTISPSIPALHYVEVDVNSPDKIVAPATNLKTSTPGIIEVDAMDCKGKWYQAFIVDGSTESSAAVKIHYMGWDPKWDETIPRANYNTHLRPRTSCEIGPRGPETIESVRRAYLQQPEQSAQSSGGAIVVSTCNESLSLLENAESSGKVSWREEPCIMLTVCNSNLRVRSSPSLESSVVGLLLKGKSFWFTKVVGLWAKLSPLHYSDLSQAILCHPKDFKPHDPFCTGWCLMRNSDGEHLLSASSDVPSATSSASSSSIFSSSGLFGGGVASSAAFSSFGASQASLSGFGIQSGNSSPSFSLSSSSNFGFSPSGSNPSFSSPFHSTSSSVNPFHFPRPSFAFGGIAGSISSSIFAPPFMSSSASIGINASSGSLSAWSFGTSSAQSPSSTTASNLSHNPVISHSLGSTSGVSSGFNLFSQLVSAPAFVPLSMSTSPIQPSFFSSSTSLQFRPFSASGSINSGASCSLQSNPNFFPDSTSTQSPFALFSVASTASSSVHATSAAYEFSAGAAVFSSTSSALSQSIDVFSEPEQQVTSSCVISRCTGKFQVHDNQTHLAIRSESHFSTGQSSVSLVCGSTENQSSASCQFLGSSTSQEWWPWIQCDAGTELNRANLFAPFPPEVSPHVRSIMRKLSRRRRWRELSAEIARALARKYPTQQHLDNLSSVAGQFSTEVECLLYSLKHRNNSSKANLLRSMLCIRSELGFTVKTVLNAIDRYSLVGNDSIDTVTDFIYQREDLHGADSESEEEEDEIIVPQSRALESCLYPIPTDPIQSILLQPQAKCVPSSSPHSGEFRRVTARPPVRVSPDGVVHPCSIKHYCNSEDGDDGLACLHMSANGSVIHQNHWSCCGLSDESNSICGQVSEDLFSIEPIPEVSACSAVASSPDSSSAHSNLDIVKTLSCRLRRRRRYRSQCQELAKSIISSANPPFTAESASAFEKSKLYAFAEINLWIITHPQYRERSKWLLQLFSTLSDFGISNAVHLACKAANVQSSYEHAVAWAMDHLEDDDLYHDSASEDIPDSSSGALVEKSASVCDEIEEFKFESDLVNSLLFTISASSILDVNSNESMASNTNGSIHQKQSDISTLLRIGCKADLSLCQALQCSHTASCFHAGFIVSKLLTSSSPSQLSAFVASEKGRLMCDFLIKQVAMENEIGGNGRSEMLSTLSSLFSRADTQSIFSSRIVGFLSSSDPALCTYALSYLSKCACRNDEASVRIISDGSVIAALCKLLRWRISEVSVIASILGILSCALRSIDDIDIDTWTQLFDSLGASKSSFFVDKLGVLEPANSTLRSIAGNIVVSLLCKNGGYKLIKAPFFDAIFGCKSCDYSYSPAFCTLWLLKLHQRISHSAANAFIPKISGGCIGRILSAISAAARLTFEGCTVETDVQSSTPFSCGLLVCSDAGNSSLQPNSLKVTEGFKGTISPIILPSWESLSTALLFCKVSSTLPPQSFVCVRAESDTSLAIFSNSLVTLVSRIIDSLENRTFDSFIAALGSPGNFTHDCIEIRVLLCHSSDCSNQPLSLDELNLLQTIFGVCCDVARDFVRSLSFDDITSKLVPEAPVIDVTGIKHSLQDCFSIFPKFLRQAFSNACIIATVRQNLESPEVIVSRYLARRSNSSHLDIDGMSVFAQLMDYFTSHGFSAFCLTTRGDIMPFRVKFKGEDGQDATQGRGGLFRECLSVVAEELSSFVVPVFVHRGKDEEFEVDPLILSPLCASTHRGRSCLMFLGVLMGVAMRSGEPLALDIHSSVWHALVDGIVSHPVDAKTADDLISNKAIALRYASVCAGHYFPDEESFFEVPTLAGSGMLVPVDNSMTSQEYQQALIRYAREEIHIAVNCVRQGLLKVVPAAALFSLSWQQLQATVCGSSSFTFEELEPFLITQQGAAISDAAFLILKNVLRSFSSQELSFFLRFCTGLLRLPTDVKSRKSFNINIRRVIASTSRPGRAATLNSNGRLPYAQTCMRTLEWPEYSDEIVAREKLITSIYIKEIDGEARAQQPHIGGGRSNHRQEDLSDLLED